MMLTKQFWIEPQLALINGKKNFLFVTFHLSVEFCDIIFQNFLATVINYYNKQHLNLFYWWEKLPCKSFKKLNYRKPSSGQCKKHFHHLYSNLPMIALIKNIFWTALIHSVICLVIWCFPVLQTSFISANLFGLFHLRDFISNDNFQKEESFCCW